MGKVPRVAFPSPRRLVALTVTADGVANRCTARNRRDAGELRDDRGCAFLLRPRSEAQPTVLGPAQAVGFTWSRIDTQERLRKEGRSLQHATDRPSPPGLAPGGASFPPTTP